MEGVSGQPRCLRQEDGGGGGCVEVVGEQAGRGRGRGRGREGGGLVEGVESEMDLLIACRWQQLLQQPRLVAVGRPCRGNMWN